MNKKGFTLVEVLGALTILGILMIVAAPAVYKYFSQSQRDAYATLVKTCYEAAHSRAVAEGVDLDKMPGNRKIYYVEEHLYNGGYMDRPADPKDSTKNCFNDGNPNNKSRVEITYDNRNSELRSYKYTVYLKCPVSRDFTGIKSSWTTEE